MDHNFPTIYLYGNGSKTSDDKATPVRIAYSRERNDRFRAAPEADWTCRNCSTVNFPRRTECFRCKVSRADAEMKEDPALDQPSHFTNTGDSDVSDSIPSQFLLFRSLESSVTEDLLAKGATKLLKTDEESASSEGAIKTTAPKVVSTSTVAHAGARPGCIRRVLLVRDKKSNESWRYGFVEFAAVEDAQAALAKFNSLEKFTIASKPVMVSYIHAGVFKPVLKPRDMNYSFGASTNPDLKLAYWDDDAYANVLVVSTNEISDIGDGVGDSTAQTDTPKAPKDADGKAKKRKADSGASGTSTKKMASHLQFWTNRHNELHGIVDQSSTATAEAETTSGHDNGRASKAHTPSKPSSSNNKDSFLPQQSYTDPNKHCCYLCARKFPSAAEANRHERMSDLHRGNLKKPDLVAQAITRLQKAGVPISSAPTHAEAAEQQQQATYRDRAKERREAFNQPKQPPSSTASDTPSHAKPASTSRPTTTQTTAQDSQPSPPLKPSRSKGAALLASMGYTLPPASSASASASDNIDRDKDNGHDPRTPGLGLGAHGSGITAPIATDMYAAGVGLGAEGGKVGDAAEEAARRTRGDYGEFAQRTRDRARERFERLG